MKNNRCERCGNVNVDIHTCTPINQIEHMQIKVGDTFHRPYQPTGLEGIGEVLQNDECLRVQTQEQADRINNGEDVESVLRSLTPEDLASTKE